MILILTSADTELLTLDKACQSLPENFDQVLMANTSALQSEKEVESFIAPIQETVSVMIVRILGGKKYFENGLEALQKISQEKKIPLIVCPGDQQIDPELSSLCNVPLPDSNQVFEYFSQGGISNYTNLLFFLSDIYRSTAFGFDEPTPLPWYGLYHPEFKGLPDSLKDFENQIFKPNQPVLGLLFYRAHWMSGNLDSIDSLIREIENQSVNPLPVFCYSLKDETHLKDGIPEAFLKFFQNEKGEARIDCLINTLSYHMGTLVQKERRTTSTAPAMDFLLRLGIPVIQAMTVGSTIQDWKKSVAGLNPRDAAMNVAMPEFDGQIISNGVSFRKKVEGMQRAAGPVYRYTAIEDRSRQAVQIARRWSLLKRKKNEDKKIVIMLTSFPSKNAKIGNAVGLDTPASVIQILHSLKKEGYRVKDIPKDGDELMKQLIAKGGYDKEFLTEEQMIASSARYSSKEYQKYFDGFPLKNQEELIRNWGQAPGEVYRSGETLYIAGLSLGNIFVAIQPPRGFGENPIAIYHSPYLIPTHHYLGFYHWLRNSFQADALIHCGKHGTLEWLPGKALGLSKSCYPELAIGDLPVFYPFIINNPGEGCQAKRRMHAAIIDHLIPPMTIAETYDDLAKLEQLLEDYARATAMNPEKLPYIRDEIWALVLRSKLHEDLCVNSKPDDFDHFVEEIDGYICELGDIQIRDGLHILGQAPKGEQMVNMITALLRLDNQQCRGVRTAIAEEYELSYQKLEEKRGKKFTGQSPAFLSFLPEKVLCLTQGDVIQAIDSFSRLLIQNYIEDINLESLRKKFQWTPSGSLEKTLQYIHNFIFPSLQKTSDEITNLIQGLQGRPVPPGPSGAPTRGMPEILPTGKNFYAVDIRAVPSPFAWRVGQDIGKALLEKYKNEEGAYPETIGMVVWGTSNMRTQGDDIAEILFLLGVRPEWIEENRRVKGLQVIPLKELNRPRIDVTIRISGFFRDAFPNVVQLLDHAFEKVAGLDEAEEDNFIKKHRRLDREKFKAMGLNEKEAEKRASYRIFGSQPGSYGAGILSLINERNWKSDQDLAEIYVTWGGYAYTQKDYGTSALEEFKHRLSQVQVAVQNQDNREHDIFDSDDYLQFHGGMIAAVRNFRGKDPKAFFGDTAKPDQIQIRGLDQEAKRVFRARVVNPKWIKSIKRHGYKGALEMAATVDYMFGYDATAHIVEDWMYEGLAKTYLLDDENRKFLEEKNPWAIRSMMEKFFEAAERGMWKAPDKNILNELRDIYLHTEGLIEEEQDINADDSEIQ